jgi:autotransporter-associated beta strand protein
MELNYRRNSLLSAAALALLVNQATAGTHTWVGGGTGSDTNRWSSVINWTGGGPTSPNADVIISGTTNTTSMHAGTLSYTIRSLTFDATADGFSQLALSSAFTAGATSRNLTFSASSGNATLTVDAGATGNKEILRTGTLFSDVNLTSSLDVIHNGSGTFTFGGQTIIKGLGGINKSGTGTLLLAGSNTYTGATTITAGTLFLGHATDTLSSSSAVTVDGATAVLSIAGNSDTVGAVSLKNGGSINGTGGTLTGASYAVESGSVSAKLGGAGIALTKTTAGTVTLSGANDYTGATNVNGGKLTIASTGTINTTSAVSIGAGEFNYNSATALSQGVSFSGTGGTLSGNGTITPAVTVTSNNTYTPGAKGAAGTQTLTGAVTFNSASIFDWDIGTSGATETGHDTVTNTGGFGGGSGAAVFNVVLGTGAYTDTFWDTAQSWSDVFSVGNLASVFSSITGPGVTWDSGTSRGNVADQGYFTMATNTLTWTAVPEPTSALAGLLLGAGLLRRRRNVGC